MYLGHCGQNSLHIWMSLGTHHLHNHSVKMICDEILTCERVRAQVVSSDGQQSPADIHLQCTLHSTRTQVILSPTHMSTYSAAEQGESGSLEPIETRGNKLAWLPPEPSLLTAAPKGHVKGSVRSNHKCSWND